MLDGCHGVQQQRQVDRGAEVAQRDLPVRARAAAQLDDAVGAGELERLLVAVRDGLGRRGVLQVEAQRDGGLARDSVRRLVQEGHVLADDGAQQQQQHRHQTPWGRCQR